MANPSNYFIPLGNMDSTHMYSITSNSVYAKELLLKHKNASICRTNIHTNLNLTKFPTAFTAQLDCVQKSFCITRIWCMPQTRLHCITAVSSKLVPKTLPSLVGSSNERSIPGNNSLPLDGCCPSHWSMRTRGGAISIRLAWSESSIAYWGWISQRHIWRMFSTDCLPWRRPVPVVCSTGNYKSKCHNDKHGYRCIVKEFTLGIQQISLLAADKVAQLFTCFWTMRTSHLCWLRPYILELVLIAKVTRYRSSITFQKLHQRLSICF